jgi:hypothetical protein
MPINTFIVDLSCRHCGHTNPAESSNLLTSIGEESQAFRIGDRVPCSEQDLEERFLPTSLPRGEELRLLMRWSCPACGQTSFADIVLVSGRFDRVEDGEITAERLSRIHYVEMLTGDDLYGTYIGGTPYVARSLMPGWAIALIRALRGEPPYPMTAEIEQAMQDGIDRLRKIEWPGTLEDAKAERQLDLMNQHLDAVSRWLYAADRKVEWPQFWIQGIFCPDAELLAHIAELLGAEPWWTSLADDLPAKSQSAGWLLWIALDTMGRVPLGLPDPYEPLIEAWEIGGAPHKSRKLRNEIEIGHFTLRIPKAIEDWLPKSRPGGHVTRFRPL